MVGWSENYPWSETRNIDPRNIQRDQRTSDPTVKLLSDPRVNLWNQQEIESEDNSSFLEAWRQTDHWSQDYSCINDHQSNERLKDG